MTLNVTGVTVKGCEAIFSALDTGEYLCTSLHTGRETSLLRQRKTDLMLVHTSKARKTINCDCKLRTRYGSIFLGRVALSGYKARALRWLPSHQP